MISILIATAVALTVTLLGTPLFIRWLRGKGYGQLIREDGPTSHFVKRGTPTMGGAVIILGVLLGYFTAHLIAGPRASVDPSFTASGLLVLFLMTGLGIVGLLDDGIKIFKQRSLGLRARAKFIGQAAVTIAFAVLSIQFADDRGLTPASKAVSVIRDTALDLGPILFVLWAYLLVSGFSNAVNLTDGLDGLAGGAAIACFGAYSVITFWQFRNSCPQATEGLCYEVRDPFDLALVSSALVGAVAGFLWWNASPARIFMGDTGSLALGGALAGMAILSRTELLLVVIAGLYVIITASVMIQVGYFKISGGKRVFKMAPLQHHFELSGWNEVTIVIRFWIVAGLFAAFGVGLFYAEYLGGSAL